MHDKFGFGRVLANASVEGEFHIVKNIFKKNETMPMRTDIFVSKHIKFLSCMKLVSASCQNKDLETIESTKQIIEKITEEYIENPNQFPDQ